MIGRWRANRGGLDNNHYAVVRALELDGWAVMSLASFGAHVDLLCCDARACRAREVVHWIAEVKDGAQVPSARRLKPMTAKLMLHWPGPGAVVCSAAEALDAGKLARRGELPSAMVAASRYIEMTGGVGR